MVYLTKSIPLILIANLQQEENYHTPTLQSLTGKYRGLQGNTCNENRDPAMRTGVPCNENRFFPVGIDSQVVPCELYRVWVCSVINIMIILSTILLALSLSKQLKGSTVSNWVPKKDSANF